MLWNDLEEVAVRRLTRCVAFAGMIVAASTSARATAYTDSFVVNPASFGCGYYGIGEICGGFSLFTGPYAYNPRTLSAGDTVDELVTYTSPVVVPGSSSFSAVYVGLPDVTAIGGPSQPGPDMITGGMALGGYLGPPSPVDSGSTSIASGYLGVAGFFSANPGFSITSVELTGTINSSDPNPIYGVSYGYSVVLPATPQLIASIDGGTPGHPAILPAGEIGQISVDLSGQGDTAYYAFLWAGGIFQATATVANAASNGSYLYQLDDLSGAVLSSATLNSSDMPAPFSQTLMSPCIPGIGCNLAAGEYIIGVTADSPFDPLLTLSFGTPVESTLGLGVPEPTTWALMLVGFGLIGASIRRRDRKVADYRFATPDA